MPFNNRGKKGKMYNQDEYNGAMAKHSVPGSRRRLAGHYDMTQKAFNDHMGTYKAPKPTTGKGVGSTKGAGKAKTPGSRKMKY